MAPPRSRPLFFGAVLAALIRLPVYAVDPAPAQGEPGVAQAGSGPSDQGPVPNARKDTDVWCAKYFPAQCPGFDKLLTDQDSLYAQLSACASKACDYKTLFPMDGQVVALNERVLTMMGQIGVKADGCGELSDHNDIFYLMQSALRSALAKAWAQTLANAAPDPSPDSKAALAAAATICSGGASGDPCSLAQIVALEGEQFEDIDAGCAKNPCPWQEGKDLLSDLLFLRNNYYKLTCIGKDPAAKTPAAALASLNTTIATASQKTINLTLQGVKGGMGDADKQEATLDSQITAALVAVQSGDKSLSADDVSAMETSLNNIGGNINSKSFMIDEMDHALEGESDASGKSMRTELTAPLRDQVNTENDHYITMRASLKALRMAAGFNFPKDYDNAPVETDRPAVAPIPGAAKAQAAASTPGQPGRPLDGAAVPATASKPPPPPPIVPSNIGPTQEVRMMFDPDLAPLVKAAALRKAGLTQTVGNPGARAQMVYQQDSPDTCGLVAEQQVLRAYGKIPSTDPLKQQQDLRDIVAKDGLFSSGTPADLSGALLEKYYLPTKTVYQANIGQLNQAVLTGDFVIVSVDARPLWALEQSLGGKFTFDNKNTLAHNILITGAETSKADGSIIGYYINDSGTGTAYFAPAATFQQAWNGLTRTFVQVLK